MNVTREREEEAFERFCEDHGLAGTRDDRDDFEAAMADEAEAAADAAAEARAEMDSYYERDYQDERDAWDADDRY